MSLEAVIGEALGWSTGTCIFDMCLRWFWIIREMSLLFPYHPQLLAGLFTQLWLYQLVKSRGVGQGGFWCPYRDVSPFVLLAGNCSHHLQQRGTRVSFSCPTQSGSLPWCSFFLFSSDFMLALFLIPLTKPSSWGRTDMPGPYSGMRLFWGRASNLPVGWTWGPCRCGSRSQPAP